MIFISDETSLQPPGKPGQALHKGEKLELLSVKDLNVFAFF